MRKTVLFVCLFGCIGLLNAQEKKELLFKYSFAEIERLTQKTPKPIVVFIYTNWCEICSGMKKTTFKSKEIIETLNDYFYFVLLDAETKKDITFLGKTFVYKPTGLNTGAHELATSLGTINKKQIFPTTVILNPKFEIDLQIHSLITKDTFAKILSKYLKQI